MTTTIPKIIHHIWIQGQENLPKKESQTINDIINLNPSWQHILWDDVSIRKLLNSYPELLNKYNDVDKLPSSYDINNYASMSDIARWVILYEQGGCYMDVDVECITSLDSIVKNVPNKIPMIAIGLLKPGIYSSQFILSTVKAPTWLKVFENVINATTKEELGESMSKTLETDTNNYILDKSDLSMYHCGVTSKCMIPIAVGASKNSIVRKIYAFWCLNKETIFLILVLSVIILIIYIIYIKLTKCPKKCG